MTNVISKGIGKQGVSSQGIQEICYRLFGKLHIAIIYIYIYIYMYIYIYIYYIYI